MELGLLVSVAQAFRHLHPAAAQLEVPQVAGLGRGQQAQGAGGAADSWTRSSASGASSPGTSYSVADITALVAVDFMQAGEGASGRKVSSNLARWHQEVSARPSAKA